MTAKAMMLKCVLLDANVIIEAHLLGAWNNLLKKVEIIVPSAVIHDEAIFFLQGEIPRPIQLRRLVGEGKVREMSATPEEMRAVQGDFDRVFIHGLHPGELEALALMKADRVTGGAFCTSDAAPIRALAMIGLFESGISMESLLQRTGLHKLLKKQFTERFFQDVLTEGKLNLITGQGMNPERVSS